MEILSLLQGLLRFTCLTISLIFFLLDLKAQDVYPYKIVDRHCDCPEFYYDGKPGFNLKPIDSSKNDIEIRLFISPDHHNTRHIIVIKSSNNISTANYYFKKGQLFNENWPDSAKNLKYWERNPFWKFNLAKKDVDLVIQEVIQQNLTSLKSQNEFYKGQGYFTPYLLTYKIGKHVGKFTFGNPDEFLTENPNIEAFKKYKAILNSVLPLIATYYNTTSKYQREY
jgi:hypothetical protein